MDVDVRADTEMSEEVGRYLQAECRCSTALNNGNGFVVAPLGVFIAPCFCGCKVLACRCYLSVLILLLLLLVLLLLHPVVLIGARAFAPVKSLFSVFPISYDLPFNKRCAILHDERLYSASSMLTRVCLML